ncbi:Osmotin, thaumatin-like protein [Exidia glandulosa HHB12029]|uniref:Osmotin, thaumatin-like protein n=1 Tax=Exidia glandulosa HHB12029 TaxID=1314781 RepID=A0A165NBX9_EXIGL|nr:Osmotin, thaumatin-like protein [Exidia glandulosa HHB12029]
MSKISLTFSVVALATFAAGRSITVTNNCAYTVWPGLFTTPGAGPIPDAPTGWQADPGTSTTITVPENWTSGRIWGRTECDFSTSGTGPTQCATGGCNGGLLCDPTTGTGVPPASLAEWTLGDTDSYDVSIVDGTNVPLSVTAANCPTADCSADLNPGCPVELQAKDASGAIVGCKSACFANLDGNQADSANCCSGSHNTPATCPASGVQDLPYFKNGCPNAYTFAYDDTAALKACSAKSDYTLTFCP